MSPGVQTRMQRECEPLYDLFRKEAAEVGTGAIKDPNDERHRNVHMSINARSNYQRLNENSGNGTTSETPEIFPPLPSYGTQTQSEPSIVSTRPAV